MSSARRHILGRLFRYFAAILGLALVYVLLDFSIDLRPAVVQDSYQFRLDRLLDDRPRILRQDNLAIVVIKRSSDSVAGLLRSTDELQDPASSRSSQPGYALNPLRSSHPGYFVSYAFGTDLGCGLEIELNVLRETCGTARYDFAGRALKGETEFRNLAIPDYNFSDDFNRLTIRP